MLDYLSLQPPAMIDWSCYVAVLAHYISSKTLKTRLETSLVGKKNIVHCIEFPFISYPA